MKYVWGVRTYPVCSFVGSFEAARLEACPCPLRADAVLSLPAAAADAPAPAAAAGAVSAEVLSA